MMNKKAFTLIELLVVVLIIGILAAIALPQYEKAVQKSRFAEVLLRMKSLRDAAELYVLENGYPASTAFLFEVNSDLANGLTQGTGSNSNDYLSKYARYASPECRFNACSFSVYYSPAGGSIPVGLFSNSTILYITSTLNKSTGQWTGSCTYHYQSSLGKVLCDMTGFPSVPEEP